MHAATDLTKCGVDRLKMLNLKRTSANLNKQPTWATPIVGHEPSVLDMKYFDQNGYDLTPLEQLYAHANLTPFSEMRWRTAIMQDWFSCNCVDGVHINHATLFERKGYVGAALDQLKQFANQVPLIYKLVHLRPKWGIDLSIDYVDADCVFEVFHYEWDDFDYDAVIEKQQEVEKIVLNTDWNDAAHQLWKRKDEWRHLDFDGQSKYKTDYFGIEPERFKLVAWD